MYFMIKLQEISANFPRNVFFFFSEQKYLPYLRIKIDSNNYIVNISKNLFIISIFVKNTKNIDEFVKIVKILNKLNYKYSVSS